VSEHSVKGNRLPQVLLRVAVITCLFFLIGAGAASAASGKKVAQTPSEVPTKTASASQTLPLLVDLGADKCIPCVMMAPILEELKKEYSGVLDVKFVDVRKNPEEAKQYRVRGIPTQIFHDASGNELGRHMGFMSKENILKAFEELGAPLKKPVKR
jgi:thioredoxin 1